MKIREINIHQLQTMGEELATMLKLAEIDYRKKKALKGEEVDIWKMRNALNQRKKIKELCKILFYAHMNIGNILHKPCVDRAIDEYEKERVGKTNNENKRNG